MASVFSTIAASTPDFLYMYFARTSSAFYWYLGTTVSFSRNVKALRTRDITMNG